LGRKGILLLTVMAALVLVSGTAFALTYTKSKKVSLRLNKPSYVGTALTRLASNAVGPALTLETDSTDGTSTPLRLQTETGSQPPMTVNSETRVANLNADKIDGKSSEEFANSTHNHSCSSITSGTVADARIDPAIARDSEVSNGFIQGRGTAQHRALALNPGENLFFWHMSNPPLSLSYNCPSNLASNGFIGIKNTSSTETLNTFSDNGSGNPIYNQLEPVGSQAHPTGEFWSQGAAGPVDPQNPNAPLPLGEHITFQVHSTSFVANIEVFSVHRTGPENNCHVQAQALVTRP
jgi:hypothetical protein